MRIEDFQEVLWARGRELYRDMPWRDDTRPYYVLVSELMLQQTQVLRVIPKFQAFVRTFPDETALAHASLADVLRLWQGLGYNRRAKFLHDAAKMIIADFGGRFPEHVDDMLRLPGVGKNTAGAISAYAFDAASIFVETNVRSVYIHHFFANETEVDDASIIQKLQATIDREHPREFYWALMDYGSWLKAHGVRNAGRSKHYKKQSKLEGSVRQVRGQIVRVLGVGGCDEQALKQSLKVDERFEPALRGLFRDGLVSRSGEILHLTK